MKKLLFCLIAFVAFSVVVSCDDDDTWKKYEEWRKINKEWIAQQTILPGEDGKPYYTKIVPSWNSQAYVIIKYFNDTMLTKDNLKPLLTSTVDVKYIGRLYNDVAFDSSFMRTTPADSVFRTKLTGVIEGWQIALMNMHIGDSCEIVIPSDQAYGSSGSGSIYPYSALKFHVKLVGIPGYYVKP